MNEITNIKIKNDILECNYRQEQLEKGYIKFDMKNEKIIELVRSEYFEDSEKAAWEVIRYLLDKMQSGQKIADTEIQMFY